MTTDLDEEGCFNADLAVVHRTEKGVVWHDGVTYPLDRALPERIAEDFDEFAPLALHQIETAVEGSGLLDEGPSQRAARRTVRQIRRHFHYRVLPRVCLSPELELEVSRLADEFFSLARQSLTVTSGPRTPEAQAAAMYLKLVMGAPLRRLYRKLEAAQDIKKAYDQARAARKRRSEIVAAMARVIRDQMQTGVFVSPHLQGGAVDIRSRNMRPGTKTALQRAVAKFAHLRLIREEKVPPHFHLEITSITEADQGSPPAASQPAPSPVPGRDPRPPSGNWHPNGAP